MIETGDYVDIRYQDDVRYRKPVGIYWLQAAVVNTASALGVPPCAHDNLALSRAVADRRDRRGAGDLLVRACLRQPARRGAGRSDDVSLDDPGVEARLAKTDAMLLFTVVLAMGVLARVYLAPATAGQRGRRLGTAGDILDGACRRHSGQGTAHSDGGRARGA